MLSQKLHDAINAQINAELWSAYLYLSMSMDCEVKGWPIGSTFSSVKSRIMRAYS